MEEFDYHVNARGFDLEEEGSTRIASGKVDEDMQNELGIDLDEDYNKLEFTDNSIILNGIEFIEVK